MAAPTYSDRIGDDEVGLIAGMSRDDPGTRATDVKLADVELLAQRYRGRRGIKRARVSLDLVDAGAESPRDSCRLCAATDPDSGLRPADIRRMEALNDLGWLVVRVTAEDTPGGVIHRVAAARARRT